MGDSPGKFLPRYMKYEADHTGDVSVLVVYVYCTILYMYYIYIYTHTV